MIISNLRIEDKDDGKSYLIADLECGFSEVKNLWFSVDSKHKDWLTADVYDAFLIEALYPAHFYNEEIIIKGKVSPKIWRSVRDLLPAILADFLDTPKNLQGRIFVDGVQECSLASVRHVGTGFSGGVDSFCTIKDHLIDETDSEYKLDTLFFFNIGQNGNVKFPETYQRALGRWEHNKRVAKELNLNCVMMDTNMFDLYLPHWEYDAGILCRLSSVLVFQRSLSKYYISSSYTYGETIDFNEHAHHELAHFSDLYISNLLSTSNTEIIIDGAQYKRWEKINRIVDLPIAQQNLNVCVNNEAEYVGQNCSYCEKCLRTLFALEALGKLDEFSSVFDINKYRSVSKGYKLTLVQYGKEKKIISTHANYVLALERGVKLPSDFRTSMYFANKKFRHFVHRVLRKLHIYK